MTTNGHWLPVMSFPVDNTLVGLVQHLARLFDILSTKLLRSIGIKTLPRVRTRVAA